MGTHLHEQPVTNFCTAVCVDMDPLACAWGYISLIRHIHMKLTIILDGWMDVLCWKKSAYRYSFPWILLCAYDAFARWQHMITHKQMQRQGLKTKWVHTQLCLSFFRSSFITSAQCHRGANSTWLKSELKGRGATTSSAHWEWAATHMQRSKPRAVFRSGCKLDLSQGAWCTPPI
jgi:hypothetical protein